MATGPTSSLGQEGIKIVRRSSLNNDSLVVAGRPPLAVKPNCCLQFACGSAGWNATYGQQGLTAQQRAGSLPEGSVQVVTSRTEYFIVV